VSETAAALSELLDSADEVINGATSYLIGQLAAELIASAPDAELSRLIVATQDSQHSGSSDREALPKSRQLLLSMLSGLLQGVLADRQSAGRSGSPLTVRERVLNLLAIEPQNPTSLSTEIGCSIATASRALSGLRKAGLVENIAKSDLADRRRVIYQLTSKGEKRQDDRFLGQLEDDAVFEDDYENDGYGYGQPLADLTHLVAELNEHDPGIAVQLYPTLEVLKDQVDDPKLRAAALSELTVPSRSKPDLVLVEQAHRMVEKLMDLAQQESPLRAALVRAERALQTMRHRKSGGRGIEA
jgi:DNA-binding MarR family transcriptional regulator